MSRINVTRPSMPPYEEYIEEIKDIWDSRWLTHTGPKHQKLSAELKEYLGTQEVSLFCNGHQALEAVLSLFPAGSEVITTPFTFASTTLAVDRAGLVPVFCDIEPIFYTLDPAKIEALITEKTVAILPVHVYGNLCDWRAIREIADRHGLKVIYDAAHAFGVREGENMAANLGDVSMFSFHATKVFHTIEGGCLTHGDPALTKRFAAWRQYGMYDGISSEISGTNAKLTEFAAAMGLCNLRHVDDEIALRKEAAMRYRERLSCVKGLVLCPDQKNVKSNFAYLPVRIVTEEFGATRDEVADKLLENDIFARKYFFPLTSEFPVITRKYTVQDTPIAKEFSGQILCLPLYAGLSEAEVDKVCDAILAAQGK